MQSVNSLLPDVDLIFELPTVIVIGGRSAGKSSLLENITKCSVFPRHRDVCTKRPIKLQLKQVSSPEAALVQVLYKDTCVSLQSTDDILGQVEGIMKDLHTITVDEIVIKICKMDVPTIELVDLPGIQMYPPELYQQTTQLVNSYINAPDTLVLCVVDATIPSLDSSVAIKAVRDADKLPRTILALTKADLIQDEESIVEQIFERVLGNSAELKDLAGLAGCVAVVNRVSQDNMTLLEAASAEQDNFSKLFADPAEAYAPPEVQKQLRSNTTTSQLIAQLDSLFHQHIVESWTPSALSSIQYKLSKMQRKIERLGPAPESLDPTTVLKVLVAQVQQDGMWPDVAATQIRVYISTDQGAKVCSLPHLDTVAAANQHAWGSYSWAATSNAMRRAVLHAIDVALSSTAYLERISSGFAEAAQTSHDIKPQRFKTLNTLLHDQVLAKLLEQAFANCKPVLVQMVHDTFNSCHETRQTADMFQVLDSCMRGCILQHIQACLGGMTKPEIMPEGFKLEEDAATSELRIGMISKIAKLQEASNAIRLIAGSAVTSDANATQPLDASETIVQHAHSEQDGLIPDFCFTWPDDDDVDVTTARATKRRKKLKRCSNDQDCNVKRPAN